ncbi:MAG: hypothetical protein WC915_05210 [archaeon]
MPNKRPIISEEINFHRRTNLEAMQRFVKQKKLSQVAQVVATHGSIGASIENLKKLENFILRSNTKRPSHRKAGMFSIYTKQANIIINKLRETIPERIAFMELCINEARDKPTTDQTFFVRAEKDLKDLNWALKQVNEINVEIEEAELRRMQLNTLLRPLEEKLALAQQRRDFKTSREIRDQISRLQEE